MKIIKCDICNKESSICNTSNNLITMKYQRQGILVEDICDDCLQKVKNFINRLKLNGNE